jgi:hypothetical protein
VSRSATERVDWQTVQGYSQGAMNRVANMAGRTKEETQEKAEKVEKAQ